MKVLVLGGTGMLGHKLVQRLRPEMDVWTTIRGPFEEVSRYGIFDSAKTLTGINAANFEQVRNAVFHVEPDVVINAIGVIKQVPDASSVITTLAINSILPHQLAQLAEASGFRVIYVSTDCVFDGKKGNYTEEDTRDALDLYGTSKRLGEVIGSNCLTLRTSIIGRELNSAHSLLEWFFSNRGKEISGYLNAIYSGFPTIVFADTIKSLLQDHGNLSGLYNVSSDPINKYELLLRIKERFQLDISIRPDGDFQIDRSLDSTLFQAETGIHPPSWDEMIDRMASDPTPYGEWDLVAK